MASWLIPLISLLTIIIFIGGGGILFLRSKPFAFHCFGCEDAGWWYKCKDGTGPGTDSCEAYQGVDRAIQDAKQNINDIKSEINKIKSGILKPVEAFNSIKSTLDTSFNNFNLGDVPTIDPNKIKVSNVNIGSCGVNIPGVGTIDPCSAANTTMNGSITALNASLGGVSTGLNETMKGLAQIPKILRSLKGVVDASMEDVKEQLDQLNVFKGLFDEVGQLTQNFKKLDLVLYIQVLLVQFIQSLIPGISFSTSITLMIGLIIAIVLASLIGVGFSVWLLIRIFVPIPLPF